MRQHLWNSLAERCKTYNLHFPNSKKLFPSNLEEDVKQIWKEPSKDFIESVFLADFMDKENLYTARMVDIDIGPNEWVSMDHTFKVACNIGLKRKSESKWETLYDSLFCVMNENGQVMGWQFTKGTSFESVRKLLQGIKKRCDKKKQIVRSCYIDNCCAWRKKLQGIFTSNCSVKLDLFHAVSSVVTEMPKRHPFHGECSRDFTLVLRSIDDYGPIRKKTTPVASIILGNMDTFQQKWKSIAYEERPIINIKALDELRKLQNHITKGCLSEIPPGCGSERNENLHKWLRNVVFRNRLSVPLALALFTTYFYVWNEKRQHGSSAVVSPIECLILGEPSDSPQAESFGIPQSTESEQDIPSVFLEECQQHLCDEEETGLNFSDVAGNEGESIDQNNLTKEELHSIIDQTLILYNQYQSLKKGGLLSVLNPRFVNLMHQQTLFAFDTLNCKKDNLDGNINKLDPFVSGLGFQIVPVPKDGDCLFTSVIFQLDQMGPLSDSNDLSAFIETLKLCSTTLDKVLLLRGKLVDEWLSSKEEYEKFLVDTELEDMAPDYRNVGIFTRQLGNMMLLGLANVLKMSFVVFTSMEHFPVIPVSPRTRPITAAPIYLAYNHAGPGHYDAVIFNETITAASSDDPNPKEVQDAPSKVGGCRCGKGAAHKRTADGAIKSFCVQIAGERRVSCPCFLAQQGCNNCRCFNCANRYGKQDNSENKDLKGRQRNRDEHFVQKNSVSSKQLIKERNVNISKTSWSELETLLFESVINEITRKPDGDVLSTDVSYLMKTFNCICNIINSSSLPIPVNGKTIKQIEGKLKHLIQQTTLFRELYMNQVSFNMSR